MARKQNAGGNRKQSRSRTGGGSKRSAGGASKGRSNEGEGRGMLGGREDRERDEMFDF